MKKVALLFAILVATLSNAQVGVGTTAPNASALLDVYSTTAGFLMPRLTTAQRTAITTPAAGLQVYDTDFSTIWYYNGTTWINSASAAITASNGLSLASGNIKLGGALVNSTTISGLNATNNMAFTSTPVDYDDGLNAFSIDGATFSVNTYNHAVGIGTTDPSTKLHVKTSGSNIAIYGQCTGTFPGVYGESKGDAISGATSATSTTNVGVYGKNTYTSGTGILGAGNNESGYTLNAGSGGSFTGYQFGVYARATISGSGSTDRAAFIGGFNENATFRTVYLGARIGGTNYKVLGTGSASVSTTMPTRAGERILFAPEAPENWFFDIGEAELVNGTASVVIDPVFVDCIADSKPFKVFVQNSEGTLGSIRVKRNQQEKTFILEDTGGASNGTVQYIIYGIWKQKENLRFPEYKKSFETTAKETAKVVTSTAENLH